MTEVDAYINDKLKYIRGVNIVLIDEILNHLQGLLNSISLMDTQSPEYQILSGEYNLFLLKKQAMMRTDK